MRAEELFKLIDKIDEELIEDAWTGCMAPPEKVTLEHSPFEAIKLITAVAACVALFASAFYIIMRVRMENPAGPNDSGAASFSLTSEISDSAPESSEPEESGDTEDSSKPSDITVESKDDTTVFPFEYKVLCIENKFSNIAEKLDNLDYAVINVLETDATENEPIFVAVCAGISINYPISETVAITGPGRYVIPYIKLRGAGSENYLYLHTEFESKYIYGEWIP